MKLSPAIERYVLHWGEMGTRWGTNRTVAQIQALLYLSPEPLRADQIVELIHFGFLLTRNPVVIDIHGQLGRMMPKLIRHIGDVIPF